MGMFISGSSTSTGSFGALVVDNALHQDLVLKGSYNGGETTLTIGRGGAGATWTQTGNNNLVFTNGLGNYQFKKTSRTSTFTIDEHGSKVTSKYTIDIQQGGISGSADSTGSFGKVDFAGSGERTLVKFTNTSNANLNIGLKTNDIASSGGQFLITAGHNLATRIATFQYFNGAPRLGLGVDNPFNSVIAISAPADNAIQLDVSQGGNQYYGLGFASSGQFRYLLAGRHSANTTRFSITMGGLTTASDKITIYNSSGEHYVGINKGATNPAHSLDVSGSIVFANGTQAVHISGSATSTGSFGQLDVARNAVVDNKLLVNTTNDARNHVIIADGTIGGPTFSGTYVDARGGHLILTGNNSVTVSPHLLPNSDNSVDLGSTSARFNDIHFGGNISGSSTSTGSFGRVEADGNINLKSTDNALTFTTGSKELSLSLYQALHPNGNQGTNSSALMLGGQKVFEPRSLNNSYFYSYNTLNFRQHDDPTAIKGNVGFSFGDAADSPNPETRVNVQWASLRSTTSRQAEVNGYHGIIFTKQGAQDDNAPYIQFGLANNTNLDSYFYSGSIFVTGEGSSGDIVVQGTNAKISGSSTSTGSFGNVVTDTINQGAVQFDSIGRVGFGVAPQSGYQIKATAGVWLSTINQINNLSGNSGVGNIKYYSGGASLKLQVYGPHGSSENPKGIVEIGSQDVGYSSLASHILHSDPRFVDNPSLVIRSRSTGYSYAMMNYHTGSNDGFRIYTHAVPSVSTGDITFYPSGSEVLKLTPTKISGSAKSTGSFGRIENGTSFFDGRRIGEIGQSTGFDVHAASSVLTKWSTNNQVWEWYNYASSRNGENYPFFINNRTDGRAPFVVHKSATDDLLVLQNSKISGSATSTGSFGRLEVLGGGNDTSIRIKGDNGSGGHVNNSNTYGIIDFDGLDDNGDYITGAQIKVAADSPTGAGDMPSRIQFFTRADGGSLTEAYRITDQQFHHWYGRGHFYSSQTYFGAEDSDGENTHSEIIVKAGVDVGGGNTHRSAWVQLRNARNSGGTYNYTDWLMGVHGSQSTNAPLIFSNSTSMAGGSTYAQSQSLAIYPPGTHDRKVDVYKDLNVGVDDAGGNLKVYGDITATGDIIAENFIVSSSVTYMTQSFSSGSTIFGDTGDDTHQFTGSLKIQSGSIDVTSTQSPNYGMRFVTSAGHQYFKIRNGNSETFPYGQLILNWGTSLYSFINMGGSHNLKLTAGTSTSGGSLSINAHTAEIANFHGTNGLTVNVGNISGSSTSTGSFGSLVVADAIQGDTTLKGGFLYFDSFKGPRTNSEYLDITSTRGFRFNDAGDGIKFQVDGTHSIIYLGTTSYDMTSRAYGNVEPGTDNTYNLGSSTKRWANIHSADLHLSNEDTEGNEVDGTTGNWTIQEGEDDLYLLNRKNGKKYRFKLEEIK
jgi:hypothetical protein